MNSVPLVDVLPWVDEDGQFPHGGWTLLICDSIETDGQFLLHTFAAQALLHSKKRATTKHDGRVLWVATGCNTKIQILTALKRIGCDAAASLLRTSATAADTAFPINNPSVAGHVLEVIPVTVEVAMLLTDDDDDGNDEANSGGVEKVLEKFLKRLFLRIKTWREQRFSDDATMSSHVSSSAEDLLVIDNVTAMATLFGKEMTFVFVQMVRDLMMGQTKQSRVNKSRTEEGGCLVLRCSHDLDQEYFQSTSNIAENEQKNNNTLIISGISHREKNFVGAGGANLFLEEAVSNIFHGSDRTWERSLVELADGIIDVVPLPSGFAKEVHGRLVFTERKGGKGWHMPSSSSAGTQREDDEVSLDERYDVDRRRGVRTKGQSFSTTVANYCYTDSGVKAIRLRAGT